MTRNIERRALNKNTKIRPRQRKSAVLSVIDLFSGCGGMSLGFEMAGHRIVAAVEIDNWAAQTYIKNCGEGALVHKDINDLSDTYFANLRGIDVLVGGPPCQGFSISAFGKRRHSEKRDLLFREFLRAARIISPPAILMENVPGIRIARLSSGERVIDEVHETLNDMGYHVEELLLDSADFGVPQHRRRYFIFANKLENQKLPLQQTHHAPDSIFKSNGSNWLTVHDAISDLPEVTPREVGDDALLAYETEAQNSYQTMMRSKSSVVSNHVPMRHTSRLIERFERIPQGGNELDAWKTHAPWHRGRKENGAGMFYDQNHRRLVADSPSPTVTASFYSSFVHPTQPRNLTVREAARLQSFPDDFRFCGKRTTLSKSLLARKGMIEDLYLDQFNQVGNAVPPLLARALADSMASLFRDGRNV